MMRGVGRKRKRNLKLFLIDEKTVWGAGKEKRELHKTWWTRSVIARIRVIGKLLRWLNYKLKEKNIYTGIKFFFSSSRFICTVIILKFQPI